MSMFSDEPVATPLHRRLFRTRTRGLSLFGILPFSMFCSGRALGQGRFRPYEEGRILCHQLLWAATIAFI